MKTLATLFSGGGAFDAGAIEAGYTPIWGVEYDAQIASVYAQNFGPHCIVSSVESVDYSTLQSPFHLHASPSCKKASVANKERGETAEDISAAEATARAIRVLQSPQFSLENVWQYRKFESFKIILRALEESGYAFGYWHLNSADYGGLIPCPKHASSVTSLSARGIAPDIVRVAATMRPDAQARILAWDVVAHLVRATEADTAASAIWRLRQGGISGASATTDGRANASLTSTDTSRFALTEDTFGSIESLLNECLDDASLKERWFTTSTAIKRITLLKILRCLGITASTSHTTTPRVATLDCPLCQYSGVPQTRKRLILLASKTHRPCKPIRTHCERGPSNQSSLFSSQPLQKWNGWYAAIEDLIPTLPESKFAEWQLKRLPQFVEESFYTVAQQSDDKKGTETGYGCPRRSPDAPALTVTNQSPSWFKAFIAHPTADCDWFMTRDGSEPVFSILANGNGTPRAFIVDGKPADYKGTLQVVNESEPVVTITASQPHHPFRAFILDGKNTRTTTGEPMTLRDSGEPCFSIPALDGSERHKAFVEGISQSQPSLIPQRDWLSQGRVVSMTPRALARFQSIPDWFLLPDKNGLACTVIGNGVPSLLGQRMLESYEETARKVA